eukprot:scaffold117817_cov48-Attheya_sp.AAC.1
MNLKFGMKREVSSSAAVKDKYMTKEPNPADSMNSGETVSMSSDYYALPNSGSKHSAKLGLEPESPILISSKDHAPPSPQKGDSSPATPSRRTRPIKSLTSKKSLRMTPSMETGGTVSMSSDSCVLPHSGSEHSAKLGLEPESSPILISSKDHASPSRQKGDSSPATPSRRTRLIQSLTPKMSHRMTPPRSPFKSPLRSSIKKQAQESTRSLTISPSPNKMITPENKNLKGKNRSSETPPKKVLTMEQKDHIRRQAAHYAEEARILLDSVLPRADGKPNSDSSNQKTDASKKSSKTVDKREEAVIRAFQYATQSRKLYKYSIEPHVTESPSIDESTTLSDEMGDDDSSYGSLSKKGTRAAEESLSLMSTWDEDDSLLAASTIMSGSFDEPPAKRVQSFANRARDYLDRILPDLDASDWKEFDPTDWKVSEKEDSLRPGLGSWNNTFDDTIINSVLDGDETIENTVEETMGEVSVEDSPENLRDRFSHSSFLCGGSSTLDEINDDSCQAVPHIFSDITEDDSPFGRTFSSDSDPVVESEVGVEVDINDPELGIVKWR